MVTVEKESYDASEMYRIRRDQEKLEKEERKRLLGEGGEYGGHEGEKLVTKFYAYEVVPTKEIIQEKSNEKTYSKKSASRM